MYIAADHLGVEMEKAIIEYLKSNDIEVNKVDVLNHELDDYPDFAFEVGKKVVENNALGILICGNGIGMSIAANKVKGVRCARILNVDDAFKCKNHNGTNVIAISSETDLELIKEMIDTFIFTKMPSEERYLKRITKMKDFEDGKYI